MKSIMDDHYVGFYGGAQYRWLEFTKEYYLLSTVLKIYQLQPESNRTQELKKLFGIMKRRLENTRFWTNANQPFIIENIKSKFDTLCNIL